MVMFITLSCNLIKHYYYITLVIQLLFVRL